MTHLHAITVALDEEKRLRRQKRPHSATTIADLEAWLGDDFLNRQKKDRAP